MNHPSFIWPKQLPPEAALLQHTTTARADCPPRVTGTQIVSRARRAYREIRR